jgi:hypothetical protein
MSCRRNDDKLIKDPLLKLADELAKGKAMAKIFRK